MAVQNPLRWLSSRSHFLLCRRTARWLSDPRSYSKAATTAPAEVLLRPACDLSGRASRRRTRRRPQPTGELRSRRRDRHFAWSCPPRSSSSTAGARLRLSPTDNPDYGVGRSLLSKLGRRSRACFRRLASSTAHARMSKRDSPTTSVRFPDAVRIVRLATTECGRQPWAGPKRPLSGSGWQQPCCLLLGQLTPAVEHRRDVGVHGSRPAPAEPRRQCPIELNIRCSRIRTAGMRRAQLAVPPRGGGLRPDRKAYQGGT